MVRPPNTGWLFYYMEVKMNLIELSELLLDEKKAEQYLLKVGILKTFTQCEKCGSSKLGRIRRGRYKCYGCKAEWGFRKGSVLHEQSITTSQFIGLIKLFVLDTTALIASKELAINRKTALRFYELFRCLIMKDENNHTLGGQTILKNESPTFSITILSDKVFITTAKTDSNHTNLFTVKRTRVPNKEVTYHFNYGNVHSRSIKSRMHNFPISQNHFWRYANEKLLKFRGTKLDSLYKFLKEIEFRYNNGNNLFEKLIEKITNF